MPRHSRHRLALAGVLVLVLAPAALLVVTSASGTTAAAPNNTVEPSLSGVPLDGNTLSGNRGTWTGTAPITYSYAWLRCDENAANCKDIAGATADTYKIVAADIGATIRFQVTAKNSSGSASANSNPTVVVSTPTGTPVNSKPPTISGSPVVGNELTAAAGTWVGASPITYSYQWQRCDTAGNACNGISAATHATYKVSKNDVGKTIRVKVTGKNSKGKSSAISNQTATVQDVSGSGIITLPDGTKSVAAADIPSTERLIVDQVRFTPSPVKSRSTPIEIRVKVKDTRGYVVRDAYVFVRSTPLVTSSADNGQTATDGWITYHVNPESDFPIKNGYSVQFFVKAYRKTDKSLTGIYGTRLVQVATSTK